MSTTRDCTGDAGQPHHQRRPHLRRPHRPAAERRLPDQRVLRPRHGAQLQRRRARAPATAPTTTGPCWPSTATSGGTPAPGGPQLVVVGLGINDFSTALNAGEPWTPDALVAAYRDRVPRLPRQAPRPVRPAHLHRGQRHPHVQRHRVRRPRAAGRPGAQRPRATTGSATGTTTRAGLDHRGCHWHPSPPTTRSSPTGWTTSSPPCRCAGNRRLPGKSVAAPAGGRLPSPSCSPPG